MLARKRQTSVVFKLAADAERWVDVLAQNSSCIIEENNCFYVTRKYWSDMRIYKHLNTKYLVHLVKNSIENVLSVKLLLNNQ